MENLMKRHYVADQTNDVVDVADPDGILTSQMAVAALSAQIWEAIICFGDEVEYLWRGKIRAVKLLYACSRYLMLLGQVASDNNKSVIRDVWHYHLYSFNMDFERMQVMPFFKSVYNKADDINGTSAGVGTAQIVLVLATIVRLTRRYRSGQSPTPLSTMVMNQGLAIFVLVFASVAHMMVNNFFREVNMGNGNSTASWYNSITSIGASRLILEIRKLARSDNEHCPANNLEDSETIVLTVISEPDLQINEGVPDHRQLKPFPQTIYSRQPFWNIGDPEIRKRGSSESGRLDGNCRLIIPPTQTFFLLPYIRKIGTRYSVAIDPQRKPSCVELRGKKKPRINSHRGDKLLVMVYSVGWTNVNPQFCSNEAFTLDSEA
ncbi:hypothetical protein JR316_0013338 [Psilocybe cubensis]|uniref:Uncharacterized protein n=1 Tax=Psilocybe cubensis TaxID=181762 RepID=A0ACB8GHE3_PSICU|nr:hypothetical protein JR316_0013338 [Psilocybe cubensis]KAH9474870.1 hypothetical protein JR316_0013338 [Psilocybe cubensis]